MDSRFDRPLDAVLRARLHLPEGSVVRLSLVRAVLSALDALSRLISGQPFFALKESEDLLRQLHGLSGFDVPEYILNMNAGTRIVAHGLEHVPARGAVIIASTHPTGMFDFIAHAGALRETRPDLKVVANQEVERFLGEESIVPVKIDKQNRAESSLPVLEGMQHHLEQGGALLIFGSGRVPDRTDGRLVEPQWRSGTSRISQTCQVPVVPAAINARNSEYYYSMRKLGKVLSGGNAHFGAMLGSLRYVAELLEKLGKRTDVHYGPQLAPGTASETLQAMAQGLVPELYGSVPAA